METFLGYILSGPVYNVSAENTINLVSSHTLIINVSNVTQENCKTFRTQENCKDLDAKTTAFFDLETLGITPNEASVHEHFKDEIKFVNNRYEVKLPFKEGNDLLPDNYMLTLNRLKSPLKRLRSDPELLKEYDAIMKEQSKLGILEDVDPNTPGTVGRNPLSAASPSH